LETTEKKTNVFGLVGMGVSITSIVLWPLFGILLYLFHWQFSDLVNPSGHQGNVGAEGLTLFATTALGGVLAVIGLIIGGMLTLVGGAVSCIGLFFVPRRKAAIGCFLALLSAITTAGLVVLVVKIISSASE
jgi:hypothetical protein